MNALNFPIGNLFNYTCTFFLDDMYKLYLIITNISKPANIKSLLKAAVAFGAQEVLVVGQKKFNFNVYLDQGESDVPRVLRNLDDQLLRIKLFDWMYECVDYVHNELNAKICGVEIVDSAKNLGDEPFIGDTALMMGNEGSGMNSKQIAACDFFIKISQYGDGTASLNVNVAANIVMHHFHEWVQHKKNSKCSNSIC